MLWYAGFRGAMATALALGAVLVFKEGRFGDLFLILTLLTAGLNVLNYLKLFLDFYLRNLFTTNSGCLWNNSVNY